MNCHAASLVQPRNNKETAEMNAAVYVFSLLKLIEANEIISGIDINMDKSANSEKEF